MYSEFLYGCLDLRDYAANQDSGLTRAHFPETNFQLEYPDESLFSTLDSISWCVCQAAIRDSLQRLAVLSEPSAAPSLAGAQELWRSLITIFNTETEAVLVHGFNYPEGSYSNSIANLWLSKASEKPDNKVNAGLGLQSCYCVGILQLFDREEPVVL